MIILQVNNVSKYYGAEAILSTIKLEVQTKDRIALVGRNGAGKSTLGKRFAEVLGWTFRDIEDYYFPEAFECGIDNKNSRKEMILTPYVTPCII